jgi:acyl carrier protein
MTTEEIMVEINKIFCDVLENDSILITRETTASQIEEWDSLSHIMLVVEIEKKFKIRFTAIEVQKFRNVGEMCDSIKIKIGN